MHNGVMKAWLESSHLAGANASYIEDLYESFLENPDSVADGVPNAVADDRADRGGSKQPPRRQSPDLSDQKGSHEHGFARQRQPNALDKDKSSDHKDQQDVRNGLEVLLHQRASIAVAQRSSRSYASSRAS